MSAPPASVGRGAWPCGTRLLSVHFPSPSPASHAPLCYFPPLSENRDKSLHFQIPGDVLCLGGKEGSVPDDFISKAPVVVVFGSSHAVEAQPR